MDPVGIRSADAGGGAGSGLRSQPALVPIRPRAMDEEPEVTGRIGVAARVRASATGNALALNWSVEKTRVERLMAIKHNSHGESSTRGLGRILTHLLP